MICPILVSGNRSHAKLIVHISLKQKNQKIVFHKLNSQLLKLLAKTEQNLGEKVWVKLNDMKYMKNGITPGL